MTPKEKVLKRWPLAYCRTAQQRTGWKVCTIWADGHSYINLGEARHPRAAWARAAAQL